MRFKKDSFDQNLLSALHSSSPHRVVIELPETAMEKVMSEAVLVDLGAVSEETKGGSDQFDKFEICNGQSVWEFEIRLVEDC